MAERASGRGLPAGTRRREGVLAAVSLLIGVLAPLALAEIVLRFLPVSEGLMAVPVNADNPVFRFTPNRHVTWSRDWNFSIVNRVRVNNAGYVNDQDYDAADARPLCAVVGDSYVEAPMVPYAETLQGRLAAAFAGEARVYSFAASGAPLSQYLVWAGEARERWKAAALAIVVVGNDWDESLAEHKAAPGFHHYVRAAGGELVLRRFDFEPGWRRVLARRSALARYLYANLQLQERLPAALGWRQALAGPAYAQGYVGNTPAAADASRLERSREVTQAFLRDLAAVAGWSPDRVVLLVDGVRYPGDQAAAQGSYFVQMRTHFIAEARGAGFEAVDMDQHFFARFRADGRRFEFATDGHWNGHAHDIAAKALAATRTFARCRRGAGSSAPR
jgi:hypothetical protein